ELVRTHTRRVMRRRSPGSRAGDQKAADEDEAEAEAHAKTPGGESAPESTPDTAAAASPNKPAANKPAPGARPVRPSGTRRPTGKRNATRR
ncbi:MAG: protein translocase subunit SecF, partial [Mycobacterium sp.]